MDGLETPRYVGSLFTVGSPPVRSAGIMRRLFDLAFALLFGAGAILFLVAWYDRYWRWRGCFNELGRCFDPASEQVFLEQAGLVWGSFAGLCVLLALFFAWRAQRKR